MEDKSENPSDLARQAILLAMLAHVPFDGWTKLSLSKAVKDTELPKGADELYFPGGPIEILEFWASEHDAETLAKIQTKGLHNMRIRDKVTECVWIWLTELEDHEQASRRAIARLALPDALGQGPKQLWRSADMIWRAIGDTSTDGNFYSKRTILSGVLGSSLVAYLADDTEGKSKARAFLEARIGNVMKFEKTKFAMRKRRETMPEPAEILGRLRYGRRRRRSR